MRDRLTLLDRIDSAIKRITSGQAAMRVPAEDTDPDLVLCDCHKEIIELRAALAKASEDWRRMMAHIAREIGDDEDRGAVDDDPHFYEQFDPWECVRLAAAALRTYRRSQFGSLAARVVEESGNG